MRIVMLRSGLQEFSLVALIVAVLGMIIIPVPQAMMDVLIAVNICLTVIVMMVVLYMHSPLEMSSFPSILLVLALFRIGITISSSRLILLDADAGEIITAFGNFVVGGNLVVGIIIFAIITLINFIVITKGSERVAEVTARFSLDAMPGKQMSIDSDLRAGNINMEEARRRRSVLALESKLFGSMDGAMKFVKGDAIASIMDILINIVGGLVIGILQHSLTFGDALKTYSILTVGDGLVQQIPSLLISITAGIMITRVSDDENQDDLGVSIIRQLFSKPKVLYSSAILFLLLSMVPGMPTVVFLILFVALIIFAFVLNRNDGKNKLANESGLTAENKLFLDSSNTEISTWKVHQLMLQIAPNLKNTPYVESMRIGYIAARHRASTILGLELPKIMLEYSEKLSTNTYKVNIFELPRHEITIYPNNILVLGITEPELMERCKPQTIIINSYRFSDGELGIWASSEIKEVCDELKINYISVEQFIKLQVEYSITSSASEFIGMLEVKQMLDRMVDYQELIKELFRMLSLNKVTEIIQRLIEEKISIRNFKLILDTLLEWGQKEREVVILVEYTRVALGRYITNKFAYSQNHIYCFLLDEEIEEIIREGIRVNEVGCYLSIDPAMQMRIVGLIISAYEEHNDFSKHPVVVTQLDVRSYIKSILKIEAPNIMVLSYQELEKYAILDSIGVIAL